MTKTQLVNFKCSTALRDALIQESKKQDASLSYVIRQHLKNSLEQQQRLAADASSQNVALQQLKNHLKKAPNSTIIILTH